MADHYFIFTDETNQQPNDRVRFFIYGAAIIPLEALPYVSSVIDEIRTGLGFQPEDELKFATNTRPDHVSFDEHTAAKRAITAACSDSGVQLIFSLTLHEIARNQGLETTTRFSANTVLKEVNSFLYSENAYGSCIMDRLPFQNGFGYMREKFQHGLNYPNRAPRRLTRILQFAASCEGASHFMSAADILLGAFRYCVNERERREAPLEMLPTIARMMWHRERNGKRLVRGRGLILRPMHVDYPPYKNEYDELIDHLQGLIDER